MITVILCVVVLTSANVVAQQKFKLRRLQRMWLWIATALMLTIPVTAMVWAQMYPANYFWGWIQFGAVFSGTWIDLITTLLSLLALGFYVRFTLSLGMRLAYKVVTLLTIVVVVFYFQSQVFQVFLPPRGL